MGRRMKQFGSQLRLRFLLVIGLLLPMAATAADTQLWNYPGPWIALKLTGVESSVDGGAAEIAWRRESGNYWRISLNSLNLDRETEAGENLIVTEDVSVQSVVLLHDWMPFQRYLRLSAGVAFNFFSNDAFDADLEDSGQYTINGNLYSGSQIGDVRGSFGIAEIAPYIGVGMLWPVGLNGFFSIDIGAVVLANSEFTMRATDPEFEQVQRDLDAAAAQLEADAGHFFTTYSIGFGAYFW